MKIQVTKLIKMSDEDIKVKVGTIQSQSVSQHNLVLDFQLKERESSNQKIGSQALKIIGQ